MAPSVHAQEDYRDSGNVIDGEPTDLEGVIQAFGEEVLWENDVDLNAPADAAEYDTWCELLLQALRDLGLLPTGTD